MNQPELLSADDLKLLVHFAIIGQNAVIVRNAHGDRDVAKELEPVLVKAHALLKATGQ